MAVPIGVTAERKVVRHFLEAGATSMADAIAYEPGFLPASAPSNG